MNIKASLYHASYKLVNVIANTSNLEARILLQHAMGKSLEYLLAHSEQELTPKEQETFEQLLNRRLALEPIAYITNTKEFYGYDFTVNNKVLIPRSDTELLIDIILDKVAVNNTSLEILEIGTGSGCIAISLLLERPNIYLTATDISIDAISVAQQNARYHNVADRIKLIHSDWFQKLEGQQFDIIVSNPPYIAREHISYIATETLEYEPHLALFADNHGLASYYIIAKEAKSFLRPQGKLFLEIGFNQAVDVAKIFDNNGYVVEKIYKDLTGHDRVIVVYFQ